MGRSPTGGNIPKISAPSVQMISPSISSTTFQIFQGNSDLIFKGLNCQHSTCYAPRAAIRSFLNNPV
jgi:hypothetical protein